jgi:hypothetical protein
MQLCTENYHPPFIDAFGDIATFDKCSTNFPKKLQSPINTLCSGQFLVLLL